MSKILVFIPAYNCERQIGRVLRQFESEAVLARFDQILILDNQSPDGTVEAAKAAAAQLSLGRVLIGRNRANVGLGGSHKNAFRYAKENGFSHIVVLHGDDQGSIVDLLPILDGGIHEKFDCCLGGRFAPGAKLQGYSLFRRFGNHAFNILFSIAARYRVFDLGAGLNIYKVDAVADPIIGYFANDLTFNCYLLLHSISKKQDIRFFPISWREDDQISNVKLFRQARRTMGIAFNYALHGAQSLQFFQGSEKSQSGFDLIHGEEQE